MEDRTWEYLSVFIMSWLLVYGLTPFIIKLARALNFVDKPAARKIHLTSTPLMGGLSVFIGFLLLCIYDVAISSNRLFDMAMLGYLFGAAVIVLLGLWDDLKGMHPGVKLIGQLAVSLIFILSNFQVSELHNMFGSVYISLPLMVLWMVGLMNALNFLDNMDGIISGMAGILGLGFFAFSLANTTASNSFEMGFIGLIALSFAGSTFGFLPYNFNPARIFLGDAGSMFIGYFLSSMGILMARYAVMTREDNMFYLLPVLLLSYAIFDISLVSYTRKRDGRHVMQGGKDHSTHRINTALGSVKITALIVYVINVLIALTTIIIFVTGNRILLLATTVMFALFFIVFGKKLDQIPIVVPSNQQKAGKAVK
jgi:UDP-GlcNAc:undecaprenyl-phosphate GlcNAc-1-phosphate transferase